jgi:hypothetical protein
MRIPLSKGHRTVIGVNEDRHFEIKVSRLGWLLKHEHKIHSNIGFVFMELFVKPLRNASFMAYLWCFILEIGRF